MAKQEIPKEKFYSTAIGIMEEARQSIQFYSISCCYGFYSYGIKNFHDVMKILRERSSKIIKGSPLDIRCLVKIDRDNPMDEFAADKLSRLQQQYTNARREATIRSMFREIPPDDKDHLLQFVIIDGNTVLASEIQEQNYVEDLDLYLNVSTNGQLYTAQDDASGVQALKQVFSDMWDISAPLDVALPRISRRHLQYVLEQYQGFLGAKSEREFQLLLMGYLQREYGPAIIDSEAHLVHNRIDILVGPHPASKRSAIEVKYKLTDDAIDATIGQLRKYRNEFEHVILVVGCPAYSPQSRQRLKEEVAQINVPLIELQR